MAWLADQLGAYWDARAPQEVERSRRHPEKRLYLQLMHSIVARYAADAASVLDVGGGYGEFSIPLARQGCEVVHLDPSRTMLESARATAGEELLASGRLRLHEGDVRDLSQWADQSVDLVLCLDAPISFAAGESQQALAEVARVARRRIVITVLNRYGLLPIWLADELTRSGQSGAALSLYESGEWGPEAGQGEEEGWFPPARFFQPDELDAALAAHGFRIVDRAAPGSLGRLMPFNALLQVASDPALSAKFLELAVRYDREPSVLGVGGAQAAGLLIIAER